MPLSIGQTFLSSVRACRDVFERSLKPSLAAVIIWQVDWQLRDQIHSAVNYKLGNVSPCGFAELSFLRRLFLFLPFIAHSSSQGFRSKKLWILKLGFFTHTFNHRTLIHFNFALWPQKTNEFIVDSEAMCVSNLINFHQGVPEMSSMGSACQKCYGNSHFLNSTHTHTQFLISWNRYDKHFRITSCLLSRSASEGERGSVLLPYRPYFRCRFSKAVMVLLMFVFF